MSTNSELGLQWLQVYMDEDICRQYCLDYDKTAVKGQHRLKSIHEYSGSEIRSPDSLLEDLTETINWDRILNFSEIAGTISLFCFYTTNLTPTEAEEIPDIDQLDIHSGNWNYHPFDFSGVNSDKMQGHYYHDWQNNRAAMVFRDIIPELLTALVSCLLKHHNTFFHMITELDMYKIRHNYYIPQMRENARKRSCHRF